MVSRLCPAERSDSPYAKWGDGLTLSGLAVRASLAKLNSIKGSSSDQADAQAHPAPDGS